MQKLFVAALAAITLVSCNKDDLAGNGTQNPDEVRGEPTTMKVSFKQTSETTRAYNESEAANSDESKIFTAKLFVFDQGGSLEKKVNMTVSSDNLGASEVFEISKGNKYLYAVINIPDSYTDTLQVNFTNMISFEKTLSEKFTSMATLTSTTAGFWMTNTERPALSSVVTATESEVKDLVNPVNNFTIKVGRAFGKVGIDFHSKVQHIAGVLTNPQYRVRNNPVQMFLMPSLTTTLPVHLETPFFFAAYDPDNYFDNGTNIAPALPTFVNFGTGNTSYMMENSNEVPLYGKSTYLSIKGVFTPQYTYDTDGNNVAYGVTGEDFWRILNPDNTYTEKYYRVQPSATEVLAVGQANAEVLHYQGGVCYYGFWLSDSNQSTLADKYTVRRNNFFRVSITQVNGAGTNDEDKVIITPIDPIEETTFMKGIIDVIDWTPVNQGGSI